MDIQLRIQAEIELANKRLKKGPTRIYLGELDYRELEFSARNASVNVSVKGPDGIDRVNGLRIYRVDTLHHIHVSGC